MAETSTDMEELAGKSFPQRLFHRTLPSQVAKNKEEKAQLTTQGFTTRYLHEEYPVILYHATRKKKEHGHTLVAESKVVQNADEEEALGAGWSRTAPPHVYTDTEGFEEIGDKHVRFLQSKGMRVSSIEDAQLYYSQLSDDMREEFLLQVENWDEKNLPFETQKKQVVKKTSSSQRKKSKRSEDEEEEEE